MLTFNLNNYVFNHILRQIFGCLKNIVYLCSHIYINHISMAKTRLRIKQILQERGMTQTELADKLGVTKITLSQNIARNNWTLGKLEEIADVLECNITDLFETAYKVKCPKCGEDIEVVLNIRGFE